MPPHAYRCGHCGNQVGPDRGYHTPDGAAAPRPVIYICSYCSKPTYFEGEEQVPGVPYGNQVENVPEDVASLYDEARRCFSVSAFTSAVLACRKLLMNIAVAQEAHEGKRFIEYVDYLADEGYVPPNGKGWVDHIRRRGNEATHEIDVKTKADAEELISFVEMLLKFIYEFPSKVPQTP
jgi:DNA-directed RNA polymerase subunit RPC12/RpoP